MRGDDRVYPASCGAVPDVHLFLVALLCFLVHLVQGVVNNIRGISELKELAISFSPSSLEKLIVDADESQLKTLFFNILDNAVKYTPAKGSISVSVEKDRSKALVTIQDTGVGIPEDEAAHIFERFYRVEKSRNSHGFGLGLSIAKAIVEAHNGTIEAKSAPSKGAAFTITLPSV